MRESKSAMVSPLEPKRTSHVTRRMLQEWRRCRLYSQGCNYLWWSIQHRRYTPTCVIRMCPSPPSVLCSRPGVEMVPSFPQRKVGTCAADDSAPKRNRGLAGASSRWKRTEPANGAVSVTVVRAAATQSEQAFGRGGPWSDQYRYPCHFLLTARLTA